MDNQKQDKIKNIGNTDNITDKEQVYSNKEVENSKNKEKQSQHDAKTTIRKHIVSNAKHIITTIKFFIVFIFLMYSVSMVCESLCEPCVKINENFEVLFFKMLELLPWLLLFIFGDTSKVKDFLNTNGKQNT
jgi:hypothetical protein